MIAGGSRHALGRRIAGVEVPDARILHTTERALREGLVGARFVTARRHGRHLRRDQRRFDTSPAAQLVLVPKGAPAPKKFAGGNEEVFAESVYTSNPAPFWAPPPTQKAE